MTTRTTATLAFITCALCASALAQQPGAAGGAVVASEPGKAAVVRAVEVTAQVVGFDRATRTITLKGPQGKTSDIVAGESVKNFDQIQLGDSVVVRYAQALTLELKKTRTAAGAPVLREESAKAKPGERPAVAGARQLTILADVVGVDAAKGTITLKGPKGNEVTLNMQNPDQFKVVKKGDQVEATYTEAIALAVEPAPKAPAAKQK